MVIIMEKDADEKQVEQIIQRLDELGFAVHRSTGVDHTVLGVLGDTNKLDVRDMQIFPGVADAYRISAPYKLVSREFRHEDTVIKIKNVSIGGDEVIVMAGPCSVESEEQMMDIAEVVSRAGAKVLRINGACCNSLSPICI